MVGEVIMLLGANFFWEEGFMQDLFGAQSDRLGASPEAIEAARALVGKLSQAGPQRVAL